MDIASALAATAQALKITKELREINGEFDRAETKAKMADIYLSLAGVKIALADTQLEMKTKDEEIEDLKALLAAKKELIEVSGFKFDISQTGEATGYAYCPTCEVKSNQLFRLVECILPNRTNCNNCESTFPLNETKKM